MHHSPKPSTQFFLTAEQDCPYLDGLKERKIFTTIGGANSKVLNDTLGKKGFRRSQNVLYRPFCKSCSACLSVRIRVKDFIHSKSQRRISNKNSNLLRKIVNTRATEEQFKLFKSYVEERHMDGGMADMDVYEFSSMIEESAIQSNVVEYFTPKGSLSAACLTDRLEDGLSMIYSFFNTNQKQKSLGTYMVLDHLNLAKELNLKYVYLGYWVKGSEKMAYKSAYSNLEVFTKGSWENFISTKDYELYSNPIPENLILEDLLSLNYTNGKLSG
jgi:arginyl-tRNA--protein-N-Asp/Glu arginylyltransferase